MKSTTIDNREEYKQKRFLGSNTNYLQDIGTLVKQDIESRIQKGEKEYGERLRPFNGRNALLDAYEEVLDLAMYLKQELIEKKSNGI